jgi:inner membrane protein
MDNVTHSLVGLAAAKAGLERVSPYATAVCVLAANAPDSDLLAYLGGRWFGFQHHRGITHSIVGVVALALLLPTIFYAYDWWRARTEKRAVRVRWGPLFGASLLLTISHPFLDWTNNYGVRPFLPWNGQWFYGDFAFVVEPFFWLTLGVMGFTLTARTKRRAAIWTLWAAGALVVMLVAPFVRNISIPLFWPLLWLAGAFAAYKLRQADAAQLYGPRVAQAALILLAAYLSVAAILHRQAETRTQEQMRQLAAQNGEIVWKTAAVAMPGNPLRWAALGETDRAGYRFMLWLNDSARPRVERFAKPQGREAELVQQALAQNAGAQIWQDFARFPAARVEGDCLSKTFAQFADLRFAAPGEGHSGNFAPAFEVECSPEKSRH